MIEGACMKNIVLFDTAIGSSNQGDQIIYDSVVDSMSEILDDAFCLRLGTHISNYNLFQFYKKNVKQVFYENADLKFICGTNLISPGRKVLAANAQWQLFPYNKSVYKGCILVGVGTAGKRKEFEKGIAKLYKEVLSDKYIHSTRDQETKELLEKLGVKAINTGCPTLWGLTEEHCAEIPAAKSPNCVITVSGQDKYRSPQEDQALVDITGRNYEKRWAWIQTIRDEEYLDTLQGTKDIKRIYSLNEYRRVLREEQVDYVGTRLHGGVFALQNKVRAIVICIDKRARSFHDFNNLPIIMREDVPAGLEDMINSEFRTEIRNDREAIETFLGQFR